MAGGKPARNALASVSFGHRQATGPPLTPIVCHMCVNRSVNSFMPKKNMVEKLNCSPAFLPRPKNQASHGTIVVTFGIPAASHVSDTGFAVSGVADATTRSTLFELISCCVTSVVLVVVDWLSLTTTSMFQVLPPAVKPLDSNGLSLLMM